MRHNNAEHISNIATRSFRAALALIILIGTFACKTDSTVAGKDTLDSDDLVYLGIDTFSLSSHICQATSIYSTPDSFLLGEVDSKYGTVHADILTQFTCPVGFQYPANAQIDSVCLILYYPSYFGDGNTPMSINVYEIDQKGFGYTEKLDGTAIELAEYCSDTINSVLNHNHIVVPGRPTDSVYNSNTDSYIPFVRLRMNDSFAQQFFQYKDFSSMEQFCQDFKGLFITSEFGSATMLHIANISMGVYYHFSYERYGQDTTVNDIKAFYANSEVRQVNRYQLSDSQFDQLKQDTTLCYVVSPAAIFSEYEVPLRDIAAEILDNVGNKRIYINKAQIRMDVLLSEDDAPNSLRWAKPSETMLLIRSNAVERFFSSNELPSDTCAIMASLAYELDSTTNGRQYYYSFDLSKMLTTAVREYKTDDEDSELLSLMLVPVSCTYSNTTSSTANGYYSSSSTSLTRVRHCQTVTATVLRSAQAATNPVRLEVIYSGF